MSYPKRGRLCQPLPLPFPPLQWESFAPILGKAHIALTRLDEELKNCPKQKVFFDPLRWKESSRAIPSHHRKAKWAAAFQKPSKSTDPEIQNGINSYRGLAIAEKNAKKKMDSRFFCQVHAQVKKNGPSPEEIGKIRLRQNWIGRKGCSRKEAYFHPPKASAISSLLENLETYLSLTNQDPLIQIGLGFAQFLGIHPFMDGNGRVARILVPIFIWKQKLLAKPVLFLRDYFDSHRTEYFQSLFAFSSQRAYEKWLLFFLNGVIHRATNTRQEILRLRPFWEKAVKQKGAQSAAFLFHHPWESPRLLSFICSSDPG